MNKKVLIIIIVVVLLLVVGGGAAAYFLVFKKDNEEEKIEPTFDFQLGETMTYLAKDPAEKRKKTVYVKYNTIIVHRDEKFVETLTKNKNLINNGMEKYFNNKTEEQIRKFRGKNVEDGKDRIEVDMQEIIEEILGEEGEKIERVLFVEFVIN